ncbi:catalase B [Cladophialophora psammophila CBS 110553]|uniref:Catalase n=1 Tax=Cladophialophora psammophila CBS 110553 TaxID=1182543 RepID=W9WE00_9EURO|nr:catalase B [Cladophialophora psammophila CBS 110553]EXJ66178.1 catalase B [Cladophialophora psammophila CBS 110553]
MVGTTFALLCIAQGTLAACPYMQGGHGFQEHSTGNRGKTYVKRQTSVPNGTTPVDTFLDQFTLNDTDTYMTSDVGGRIQDQESLKAGVRGPTLLEDFMFRQKIQHFDHERVPERAVHARGAGAHGVFTSYADWSNITAASFLSAAGKETPMFVRFSTVAGSRGSPEAVRDVHGFASRFYTDAGNFDIIGNNIAPFFIQDAIQFPDLIHAVKPEPDREIPQGGTAHTTAWDFFSQQPSSLHTLFWAMAGYGIPRSFRHMDGFGVHTYRLVTDDGNSKLVKWHWKTLQGKASLVWEEAQVLSGKNIDSHRQDLWDAIEAGQYPEWELGVQIMEESDALSFGFDLLDPTKIVPEEIVPVTILGKMTLNQNPRNYFAETEQIMFQPGHIVRGIDFTEDPLLQGRIFSYLDTQLNRHGGPNFEQLPINRPRVPIHNNNRDGAAQNYIPLNVAAYTPSDLNNGSPMQANQTNGNGFFTTPGRTVGGNLVRAKSSTFDDVWSQPRMFYNSLIPAEQQFLINAMRFETSHVTSPTVRQNVITQLNRVDNDLAVRLAQVLGVPAPAPDPTYYNDNRTAFVSIFNYSLPTIAALNVGILASVSSPSSMAQATSLAQLFAQSGAFPIIVGEVLTGPVNQTYSAADASGFDGVIVTSGSEALFTTNSSTSALYPAARPLQILLDAYRWGKPVGALDAATASTVFATAAIPAGPGVYTQNLTNLASFVTAFEGGLSTFRFVDRFPLDPS